MSALVFRLRNVPDDEAADIRALLERHKIGYFETTAGNWGISMPGIWVEDATDLEQARRIIDEYQQARGTPGQEQLQRLKRRQRELNPGAV